MKPLALFLLVALTCAAAHNPLLPRPRKVHYGEGRLSLKGVALPTPAQLSRASGTVSGIFQVKRIGKGADLPGLDEKTGPESREAYTIRVTPQGVDITAHSSAGLFYAGVTLRQLAEGDALPVVEIEDWPSLAYRGFMMDMSHGPLPTEDEINRLIDFLARWKANQYYFYSEASIELKGYPLLNPRARYSQEQVRRIIVYARERFIDVVPCMELYGHLHDLFRVEKYSDLAPLRYGGEFDPRNPRVLRVIEDWVRQFTELFPSPFFHIGMDETWELERISSKAAGGVEPGRLYIEHFKNVAAMVRARGRRPIIWGDILTKYPEVIPELKGGTIAMPWVYGPEKDYTRHVAPFAKSGIPVMIATAITNWDDITPKFNRTFDNVDQFLAAGRRYGVLGLLHTGWTDDAQVLFRMALAGIAYGAVAPWQSEPVDRAHFYEDYAKQMYPAAADEGAGALDALAQADDLLFEGLGGGTMPGFWADPFEPRRLKHLAANVDNLRRSRLLSEEAQEHLLAALARHADPATLNSLLLGARMLDYAARKSLYAVQIAGYFERLGKHPDHALVHLLLGEEVTAQDHSLTADIADGIMELREEYRRAWLAEYTPYRLGAALGRFDMEYQYWRRFQKRIQEVSRSYREGEELPALESLR